MKKLVIETNITPDAIVGNKIMFIKHLREASGLGLAEAKAVCDLLVAGVTQAKEDYNKSDTCFVKLFNLCKALRPGDAISASMRDYGYVRIGMASGVKSLKAMLQEALIVATEEGRFSSAECILNAIKNIR